MEEPRFVVDQMLGTLAKWLRVLGYDVIYSTALDDAALARIARAEQRVLLTRDRGLVRRKGLVSLLVKSDDPWEQLAQVIGELALPARALFSRCLRCNGKLTAVSGVAVADLVPPYVLATQAAFRRCESCGRIYWRGTHWQGMQERLAGLYKKLGR
jgi:uncharacterized protein with PIN domain